jgi:hypothetical protein
MNNLKLSVLTYLCRHVLLFKVVRVETISNKKKAGDTKIMVTMHPKKKKNGEHFNIPT